ncbi:MAG: aminoglycoside phosphotransferase family protein [Candidatus Magasanikbacteria bacterium]|nr:aminoglycoside phosphotransferase family protein [Candidatus Magasanikbacteria bacterium]
MDISESQFIKQPKYLDLIGEEKIIQWLRENFDLQITKLISIPKGEIGDNYCIIASDDTKYFLKIFSNSKLQIDSPHGLKLAYHLASQLYELGIKNIPYPIKNSTGSIETQCEDYTILVTNFIEGKHPEMTGPVVASAAKLVAALHQIDIKNIDASVGSFDPSYANKLREQLQKLEESNLTKEKENLAALLLPHKVALLNDVKKLNDLCDKIKSQEKKLVITHGDLISDNLLCNANDELFIIDWDNPQLAPAERDVWFFMNEHAELFLQIYKKYNSAANLDIDYISFYMYKRYLEDIVYWNEQILNEEVASEQAAVNLKGIQICCLEPLETIEEKIKTISDLLILVK